MNGRERSRLVGMQRARLVAAAGQVACECGVPNVTVAHIVERAGVSRRTFYEIFADSEDCLLSAIESAFEYAQARVLPSWQSDGSWCQRVRRSLTEILILFDEDPVSARLLLVESLGAGRLVLERRGRVIDSLVDAIDAGAQANGNLRASRVAAEGAVGGVLGVLHARITQDPSQPLLGLIGQLMSMLVLPIRGAAVARRELDRPVCVSEKPRDSRDPLFRADPFKDAGMRLTYRTVKVLSAIAASPESSNRQIGDLADMSDQGQISKLLARLERLGLIVNANRPPSKGEPNAWTLTSSGHQVIDGVGAHFARSEPQAGKSSNVEPHKLRQAHERRGLN